MQELDTAADSY